MSGSDVKALSDLAGGGGGGGGGLNPVPGPINDVATLDGTGQLQDSGIQISALGDKYYLHTQAVASASWSVTHNLTKYPAVTVMDGSGNIVLATITHTSLNASTISFQSAQTGKASFN